MDQISADKLAPDELSAAFSQLIRVAFECATESDQSGQVTVIREVAQTYAAQKSAEPLYDEVERMKQLVQTLTAFETRYGGNYKDIVSRLGDPESSDDWRWKRDADEWRYVMKEISRER